MYDGVLAYVQSIEEKIVRSTEGGAAEITFGLKVPVTQRDVEFLVEEVYKGRSVLSGSTTKIVLVRWEKPAGSTMVKIGEQRSSNLRTHDLVLMTKEEATRHLKEVLLGDKTVRDIYSPEIIEKVESKQKIVDGYDWAW